MVNIGSHQDLTSSASITSSEFDLRRGFYHLDPVDKGSASDPRPSWEYPNRVSLRTGVVGQLLCDQMPAPCVRQTRDRPRRAVMPIDADGLTHHLFCIGTRRRSSSRRFSRKTT